MRTKRYFDGEVGTGGEYEEMMRGYAHGAGRRRGVRGATLFFPSAAKEQGDGGSDCACHSHKGAFAGAFQTTTAGARIA